MVSINLIQGDCLDKLKELEDNSVDSIVTDPPYGLSKEPDMIEVLKCWMNGEDYTHNSNGFMGKQWDSFVPNPSVWKECFRVLKPGGYMLAFFGTRTYDMGVLSIRIAGFEVKDQLAWVFSTGFPKSRNISKDIDKIKGEKREIVGKRQKLGMTKKAVEQGAQNRNVYEWYKVSDVPISEEAEKYKGFGTAIKPAYEPIVLARKPLGEKTVARNVLEYGTGVLNIDDCRISIDESIDDPRLGGNGSWKTEKMAKNVYEGGYSGKEISSSSLGRFPSNLIHDGSDEVVSLFPESKGQQGDVKGTEPSHTGQNGIYGEYGRVESSKRNDKGSAARFFYCAKASKKDRNEGLEDYPDKEWKDEGAAIPERKNRPFNPVKNNHTTVKPYNLCKWLVTLITPPNGTVLDPFMGSGSTGKAAVRCGFNFIGIELEKEYVDIAKGRIEYARDNPEEEEKNKRNKKNNSNKNNNSLPENLFDIDD